MNIFLERPEQLEEIKPIGGEPSKDKGLVITPTVGKREEGNSDLQKEIAGIDAIVNGPSEASKINGVGVSSASRYSNGKDIANADSRARVLAVKNDIADIAVTKLMDTLNLLHPEDMEKPRDKIALMAGLSTLVEKITERKEGDNRVQVAINFYAPNQRNEKSYEVIEA